MHDILNLRPILRPREHPGQVPGAFAEDWVSLGVFARVRARGLWSWRVARVLARWGCRRAAKVPLLVDSAAGFGATSDDGSLLGHQGDAEVFSFHATKPFAVGEGGLVTTT